MTQITVDEQALKQVQEQLKPVSGILEFTIECQEDALVAADLLKDITRREKKINEIRLSLTRPFNEAIKNLNDFFKQPQQVLNEAKLRLKKLIVEWEEKQKKAVEEERRRLLEQAKKEKDPVKQMEIKTVAEITRPQKTEGIKHKTVYKFEIIDENAVPRELCSPDPQKIRAYINAMGSKAKIEGVKIWEEKTVMA
ncbi:MAG: hypothetical protein KatS3mg087_1646 [Patescibacteria group bacterium]|nr:MAG: hypothetical protein KatS3mg087_1646 [Patescibacteria group bacterium]